MVLVIDIGNTFCKMAVMNHSLPDTVYTVSHSELIDASKNLIDKFDIRNIAICSVHHMEENFLKEFSEKCTILTISLGLKLPFTNLYQSDTLGNDRIALVAGAQENLKEGESALVIDAGTCITYDYLDTDGNYRGGAISPGVKMRFKALHTFTSKLPFLKPEIKPTTLGTTTEKSIRSGVQNGTSMEIDSMIDFYLKKDKNLKVFLTGGDADLLSEQLKNRFFASSYLILTGIYKLYLINNHL